MSNRIFKFIIISVLVIIVLIELSRENVNFALLFLNLSVLFRFIDTKIITSKDS